MKAELQTMIDFIKNVNNQLTCYKVLSSSPWTGYMIWSDDVTVSKERQTDQSLRDGNNKTPYPRRQQQNTLLKTTTTKHPTRDDNNITPYQRRQQQNPTYPLPISGCKYR